MNFFNSDLVFELDPGFSGCSDPDPFFFSEGWVNPTTGSATLDLQHPHSVRLDGSPACQPQLDRVQLSGLPAPGGLVVFLHYLPREREQAGVRNLQHLSRDIHRDEDLVLAKN